MPENTASGLNQNSEHTKTMPIVEATPRSLFSWDFSLQSDRGETLSLKLHFFEEGGEFSWEGREYVLSREGWMSGDFYLEQDGRILIRARKESLFERVFTVNLDDREWLLEPRSVLSREFVLREGGEEIASICPLHAFTRSSHLQFPEDLGIPEQLFLFGLAVLMWKRADST